MEPLKGDKFYIDRMEYPTDFFKDLHNFDEKTGLGKFVIDEEKGRVLNFVQDEEFGQICCFAQKNNGEKAKFVSRAKFGANPLGENARVVTLYTGSKQASGKGLMTIYVKDLPDVLTATGKKIGDSTIGILREDRFSKAGTTDDVYERIKDRRVFISTNVNLGSRDELLKGLGGDQRAAILNKGEKIIEGGDEMKNGNVDEEDVFGVTGDQTDGVDEDSENSTDEEEDVFTVTGEEENFRDPFVDEDLGIPTDDVDEVDEDSENSTDGVDEDSKNPTDEEEENQIHSFVRGYYEDSTGDVDEVDESSEKPTDPGDPKPEKKPILKNIGKVVKSVPAKILYGIIVGSAFVISTIVVPLIKGNRINNYKEQARTQFSQQIKKQTYAIDVEGKEGFNYNLPQGVSVPESGEKGLYFSKDGNNIVSIAGNSPKIELTTYKDGVHHEGAYRIGSARKDVKVNALEDLGKELAADAVTNIDFILNTKLFGKNGTPAFKYISDTGENTEDRESMEKFLKAKVKLDGKSLTKNEIELVIMSYEKNYETYSNDQYQEWLENADNIKTDNSNIRYRIGDSEEKENIEKKAKASGFISPVINAKDSAVLAWGNAQAQREVAEKARDSIKDETTVEETKEIAEAAKNAAKAAEAEAKNANTAYNNAVKAAKNAEGKVTEEAQTKINNALEDAEEAAREAAIDAEEARKAANTADELAKTKELISPVTDEMALAVLAWGNAQTQRETAEKARDSIKDETTVEEAREIAEAAKNAAKAAETEAKNANTAYNNAVKAAKNAEGKVNEEAQTKINNALEDAEEAAREAATDAEEARKAANAADELAKTKETEATKAQAEAEAKHRSDVEGSVKTQITSNVKDQFGKYFDMDIQNDIQEIIETGKIYATSENGDYAFVLETTIPASYSYENDVDGSKLANYFKNVDAVRYTHLEKALEGISNSYAKQIEKVTSTFENERNKEYGSSNVEIYVKDYSKDKHGIVSAEIMEYVYDQDEIGSENFVGAKNYSSKYASKELESGVNSVKMLLQVVAWQVGMNFSVGDTERLERSEANEIRKENENITTGKNSANIEKQ